MGETAATKVLGRVASSHAFKDDVFIALNYTEILKRSFFPPHSSLNFAAHNARVLRMNTSIILSFLGGLLGSGILLMIFWRLQKKSTPTTTGQTAVEMQAQAQAQTQA